jgi:CRISPR system Cascade subunit CasC
VPLLVSNLAGDAALAGKVVEHLTHLIATVSPGAKKGSTAPYAYADLLLIEAGQGQPRTLANAYRTPCRGRVDEAVRRMSDYLTKIDAAYGNPPQRAHLSVEEAALPGSSAKSLDNLAAWALNLITSQTAA